jgi:hypothetical protein
MLTKESRGVLCLRLLKRLLEGGLGISREEASEYGECFRLLLEEGGIIELKKGFMVLPEGCLTLLKHAVESGFSLEDVFKSVNWRGFERIIAEVFKAKGFRVLEHFRVRFKNVAREIDVLVETHTMLLSIDCKQWIRRNYNIRLACRLQLKRSRLLYEYLREKESIRKAVYPIVVTFLDSQEKVLNGCLILPVWKIGELSENPEVITSMVKPVS